MKIKTLVFEDGTETLVVGDISIQKNKKEPILIKEGEMTEEDFKEQFDKK